MLFFETTCTSRDGTQPALSGVLRRGTDIGPQIDTDPEDLLGNNYAIWGNLLKFVTEGGSRNILTWTPRIRKQKK
jgi:hypothetical protein